MRKIILSLCVMGIGGWVSCQSEHADPKIPAAESAWKVFGYVEDDLQQIVELFENTLRLSQFICKGDPIPKPVGFNREKVFHNKSGWWGIADGNGCRFKTLPDDKSLGTVGAVWTARARYYSDDSIRIECTGEGQWVVNGFSRGNEGWRTETFLKIISLGNNSSVYTDSVSFLVEGNGVFHLMEAYPSKNVEVTFSIPRPLLRKDRSVYRPYAFMEGKMNLQMLDIRNGRRENAIVEIEDLPLDERMVRVIHRGVTEVHS